jgi:hypothetical protein
VGKLVSGVVTPSGTANMVKSSGAPVTAFIVFSLRTRSRVFGLKPRNRVLKVRGHRPL